MEIDRNEGKMLLIAVIEFAVSDVLTLFLLVDVVD
jgi:hypothetical protein